MTLINAQGLREKQWASEDVNYLTNIIKQLRILFFF